LISSPLIWIYPYHGSTRSGLTGLMHTCTNVDRNQSVHDSSQISSTIADML
jgi:hypothetical protein